jgi:hypothetical protein
LRGAIERRTEDSYSTLLKVGEAPGLAQILGDDYDVPTRATRQLEALVARMPGGSIGLAGPRGIGKSTLIERFCPPTTPDRKPPLLATVVSAPTEYDGREFILHLFARLCETVIGGPDVRAARLDARQQAARGPLLRPRARTPASVGVVVALAIAGALLVVAGALGLDSETFLIAGAACLVAGSTMGFLFHPRVWASAPLGIVGVALIATSLLDWVVDPRIAWGAIAMASGVTFAAMLARETQERRAASVAYSANVPFRRELVTSAYARLDDIEYQQTFASGWSRSVRGHVSAGPGEVGAEAGVTGTSTLAQTPLSFPEIVARLRTFIRQAAVDADVRIGIDELDKIESEETAHRFLNEIKGVFGIPRCFFLVSVSEEAMSNFDRRGARLRDVFDSSFDEILHVPPLSFQEARDLLRQRVIGLPIPYLALCHVLSGGLPRDLIRVARALIAAKPAGRDGRLSEMTQALIALELEARVRAVSVVARGIVLEPQASSFLRWSRDLAGEAVSSDVLLAYCKRLEPFAGAAPENLPADAAERAAHDQLRSLTVELLSFCYLAATVLAFFEDSLAKTDMDAALSADPPSRSLDGLASARAASSMNPRVGWGLVSAFREQRMPTLDLPQSPAETEFNHRSRESITP